MLAQDRGLLSDDHLAIGEDVLIQWLINDLHGIFLVKQSFY